MLINFINLKLIINENNIVIFLSKKIEVNFSIFLAILSTVGGV